MVVGWWRWWWAGGGTSPPSPKSPRRPPLGNVRIFGGDTSPWNTAFFPLLPSHPGFESQASLFFTSDSSSHSCVTYSRPPKKHKPYHHHINNSAKKAQDANAAPARRCSHCHVQKTPQWRAGPLGPKTLCNACGVRFKSGRLLPEYRPAVSPTFLSDVHSNSHRKVLELRRQKEQEEQKQVFTIVKQEQEEPKPEVFLA